MEGSRGVRRATDPAEWLVCSIARRNRRYRGGGTAEAAGWRGACGLVTYSLSCGSLKHDGGQRW